MKKRQLICIVCPNGCELSATLGSGKNAAGGDEITGGLCDKGAIWAKQELTAPQRTIASNVRVIGGTLSLVSVRTNRPIPLDKIFDVMDCIKALTVEAPVKIGDVLLEKPCDTDCQIIATRQIEAV